MAYALTVIDCGGVNCYLLKVNDGFIMIDTGGMTIKNRDITGVRQRLDKKLSDAGCTPGNLKLVLITHGDADHTGNAAYLQKTFKAKIAIHRDDSSRTQKTDARSMKNYLKRVKFRSLVFSLSVKLMMMVKGKELIDAFMQFDDFKPDIIVDDTFDLRAYGLEGRIFHLPGHTDGSIAILTDQGDFFSGDIFVNMKKSALPINAIDFKQLRRSVEKIRQLPITTIYPGHGKPFPMTALPQN